MADHLLPSQLEQVNHISENTPPYPALHRIYDHVRHVVFHTASLIIVVYSCVLPQNPHVAHEDQHGAPLEGIFQPGRNVVMPVQGEMQYPRYIDAPRANYDAAHYHPPPQPVRNILWCGIESPF